MIEFVCDPCEIDTAVSGQVSAFRKVLAQKSVGVLVGAALPRTNGITEVDRGTGGRGDVEMAGHLTALIPGDRLEQHGG